MIGWIHLTRPIMSVADVGFHIGGESGINHIVMQVHYLRALTAEDEPDNSGIAFYTTTERPKYTQGILLMVSGYGVIPPHKPCKSPNYKYMATGIALHAACHTCLDYVLYIHVIYIISYLYYAYILALRVHIYSSSLYFT